MRTGLGVVEEVLPNMHEDLGSIPCTAWRGRENTVLKTLVILSFVKAAPWTCSCAQAQVQPSSTANKVLHSQPPAIAPPLTLAVLQLPELLSFSELLFLSSSQWSSCALPSLDASPSSESFPFKLQLGLLRLLLPLRGGSSCSTAQEYTGVMLDSESWFLNQPVEYMPIGK